MMNRENHPQSHPCDQQELLESVLQSPDKTSPELEAHLATCESCRSKIESMAANADFWDMASMALGDTPEMPASMIAERTATQSTVLVQLDPRVSQPSFHHIDQEKNAEEIIISQLDQRALLDPPLHPEMLGRVDGFSVEQVIGRGGMGIVYKGFDSNLNRPVAIKFLSPHMAAHGVARARFIRESRAAAAVVHPNVVPIYSVNTSPVRPYMVMALVSGQSLQKHVQVNGPLLATDIVRIALQIAAGLSAAHQQGLVHRDIKPANIMLENDVSRVLITDFGLARAADDAGLTQTGWLAGTPNYMSPEQVRGDQVDLRSDLFSLGSVMYFMATGREPFRGDNTYAVLQKICGTDPAPPQSVNSEVPECLSDFICRLLSKSAEDRFDSAKHTHDALTQYLAYLQNPTQHPKPKFLIKSAKKKGPSKALIAATLATAVAAMLLVGWIFSSLTQPEPISDLGLASENALAASSPTIEVKPLSIPNPFQPQAKNNRPPRLQSTRPTGQNLGAIGAQLGVDQFAPQQLTPNLKNTFRPFFPQAMSQLFDAELDSIDQELDALEINYGIQPQP